MAAIIPPAIKISVSDCFVCVGGDVGVDEVVDDGAT